MALRYGKYFFDTDDLQFKRVRLPFARKLFRFSVWFAATVVMFFIYKHLFTVTFGSPKETRLMSEIESVRLEMNMISREMDNFLEKLNDFRLSDDNRYRPVLGMDTLPSNFRKPATGGIERYANLAGYMNSTTLIELRSKSDHIKTQLNLQTESFKAISERSAEWKREMEHLPMISPVNVSFRLGDGLKFREKHPVHGNPQWHHGQDFRTPVGTNVYATGAGTVIEAGWNSGGFGNYVVIDHGYGFRTTYGHLSAVKTVKGAMVKRGDLIGLSGNTGISSGPHLHYQIDLFGKVQNPLFFFNNDLTEEEYIEMIKTLSAGAQYRQ